MLIGEPYWRQEVPSPHVATACGLGGPDDFLVLPELIERFGSLGFDVVEMVLADQDSWDRYQAAQWLNLRRWLDDNPGDERAAEVRAELSTDPVRYARYQRDHLGWGVFALTAPRARVRAGHGRARALTAPYQPCGSPANSL